MGRLFWKFFFFIWLAQLTAVAGIGGTLWLKHRNDAIEEESVRRASAAVTIEAAAAALQFGGMPALQHLAENLHRYRILLVDEQRQDVFGRSVSADDIARAQASLSLAADAGQKPAQGATDNNLLARRVIASDHRSYLFFLGDISDRMRGLDLRFLTPHFGVLAGRGPGAGPGPGPGFNPNANIGPYAGGDDPHRAGFAPYPPLAGDLQEPHWYQSPEYILRNFFPFVAGLIASLLFAALLARYFSLPIRTLRGAFESIADGKLDTRVAAKMGRRRDELADLGRDFDAMASRFGALVDGQKRLLHDVSHELRSPLARLQVAIGLARQQPQKIEATMLRIERESERMDQMVGELLTLSRVEVGVVNTGGESVSVAELLAMVVDNADFEAAASGKRVVFSGIGSATILGHFELLYRAVENVVRNAVKHTAPGGDVSVRAVVDGARLNLTVADRGPGVPPAELQAIFEPFFRGSGEFRSNNTGYGLGLAIARRVILAHGGTISADNDPLGGLRVEIVLPLAT